MPPGIEQDDDALWDRLIASIAEGSVVPIIGRDLLTVERDGATVNLHTWIAEQLRAQFELKGDIPPGDAGPLNAVAAEYIRRNGEQDRIYSAVYNILRSAPLTVPRPLQQLASINKFNLFVTTTFDDLLEQALAAVGKEPPRVFSFATRPAQPSDLEVFDRTTVYHLFGAATRYPSYVVTEEDALEFVCLLLGSPEQPIKLLRVLGERNLLLIGCSFPSWFARFFLRLSRGRRLYAADPSRISYIVDEGARDDAGLLQFLRTFRTRTQVFTQHTPVEFVDALATKWADHAKPDVKRSDVMPADAVFVSYASEDRERVTAIVENLKRANLDVWFDREQLHPGDRWDPTIRNNIDRAAAFVPILSRRALNETRRYFLSEWRQALRANERIAFNDAFLFPIAIDDVEPAAEAVPPEFRQVQWSRLLSNDVPKELIDALIAAVRRKKQGVLR